MNDLEGYFSTLERIAELEKQAEQQSRTVRNLRSKYSKLKIKYEKIKPLYVRPTRTDRAKVRVREWIDGELGEKGEVTAREIGAEFNLSRHSILNLKYRMIKEDKANEK